MRYPNFHPATPLLLAILLPAAPQAGGEEFGTEQSPFAGKYLAVHLRGRNFPIPFQEAQVRYLADKCYLVGKIVPNILPKDRRTTGRVWLPLGDVAEVVEFETPAKLREFYNLAH